ncbi:MAG TPA: M20/M25/M40 family metallo-hydrolase [Rhodanobacteraceae bacterium]|nr:M20/M25/M40 family metallo-hydrolase [Rhodanobacteraceae bacterium]
MRRLAPTLWLALLVSGSALAAKPTTIPEPALATAQQLIQTARRDTTAWNFLTDLTTEIGPRLAAGPNDQRARDWVVARFKAMGFDKVWTEPVTYPKWVRRHESGAIVSPYPQRLVLTALGYSAGTPEGGLTAEVVPVKDLATLKAIDPATIKGKIVYMSFIMKQKIDGADYGPASAIRTQGPVIAAEKGAAAFLLRSAGTDRFQRMAHTGVTGFRDPAKAIPAAALSNPDADQLERVLAHGKPVRVHLDLDVGMEGEYTGANVIAEVTGRRHPKEIVAIGGHLDSWDLGTGAIDDGAGVAIAAAAAHLISKLPARPDRTIRVVAFANEEMGLWGGRAYAKRHAGEIENHVLGVESDFGAASIRHIYASVKPQAVGAIQQMADALRRIDVKFVAGRPGNGGPDFSPMHAQGMAALSLPQDGNWYFDWHHTANDTLDKVVPAQLAQNVAVYAAIAYMAAEAKGDFGSEPGAFANDKGE